VKLRLFLSLFKEISHDFYICVVVKFATKCTCSLSIRKEHVYFVAMALDDPNALTLSYHEKSFVINNKLETNWSRTDFYG
jgi:hypothetical protein